MIALLLSAAALAGCGPDSAVPPPAPGGVAPAAVLDGANTPALSVTVSAPGPDDTGDWVVLRMGSEPGYLNPYTSSDGYASDVIDYFLFEGLLERDFATLEMRPCIAHAWDISEDRLTYTFHLRNDVVFSDGAPLTAQDVVFCYDTIMNPAVDAAHLRNYYQDVVSCEAVDNFTVRFTCSQPYWRHLIMLGSLPVIPKHIYGVGDFNTHPANRKPVGTGPYVLERWDTGNRITLVRNENYWREKPRLLRRVHQVITNDNAAFIALQRQEVDVMGLTPELWTNRADTPEFRAKYEKHAYYRPFYSYLGWNSRRPQFSDKRVRRAMTMLLDREMILQSIFQGLGRVVTSNFYVEGPDYNHDIEPWPFDPAAARALLDEAGWTDSDGDGIRDKDGVPFRFDVTIVADSQEMRRMAAVYQEELAYAGIRMGVRPLEWAALLERMDRRDFDAYILGWRLTPESDPYQIWHSSQAQGGSNYVGFNNAEADEIIETARRTFDPEQRTRMFRRFHEIMHEEQAYTFLFCTQALAAVDKRFRGVTVYPMGFDQREWWTPAALWRYR